MNEDRDLAHLWAWEPLEPEDIVPLLAGLTVPWWVAGGWALDLFVGHPTRRHEDLDVALLRRDQGALHRHLSGWELRLATPHGRLRPWDGHHLGPPVHGIWARRQATPDGMWTCEFLLDESDGDRWLYRRAPHVTRALADVGLERDGIPYLAPGIALLFKSTELTPVVTADFNAVEPHLDAAERLWLRDALATCYGDHPWLQRLG